LLLQKHVLSRTGEYITTLQMINWSWSSV